MRWAFALGLVALLACGGDPATSPEAGAIALKKNSTSTDSLPSASDSTVHTEFVCGPSYPTDGGGGGRGVAQGWCTDVVKLDWLQPLGKHTWLIVVEEPGEMETERLAYGPYRSPKPIIRKDGIYQFDAFNEVVIGHRRYLEVSVQNSQPVNWGVFTK